MPSKKVLHIIKSLGRGGAERLLVETIRQHSKQFQFDVVYFLPWKNQMVKELEQLGCNVFLLPANNTPLMLWRVPALVRLIKRNKYDLIHCHLPWAGIVGRIAGRMVGVPVVYTEHNNVLTYNKVTSGIHKGIFNWFTKVIAVSDDAEKALRAAVGNRENICTILNGVDTVTFDRKLYETRSWKEKLKIPADKIVVSTVAVFRLQKRLDRWLSIAESVYKEYNNVYFVIVGDGPLKEDLLRQLEETSLKGNLLLAGLIEDPRPYLACTDIYLMSSENEGLPVALLEAMSMECVPVVTAVGGIPALIDSTNGILYDKEDTATAVSKIKELAMNNGQRNTYAVEARATVLKKYSIRRMVKELEDLYTEVLSNTLHS